MPISEDLAVEVDAAATQVIEDNKPELLKDSDDGSKEDSSEDSKGDKEDDSGIDSKEDSKEDSDDDSKSDSEDESKEDSEGDSKGDSEEDSEGNSEGDSDKDSSKDSGSESSPPVISDAALTTAAQAGLSIADARQFPSDASLLQAVASIDAVKKANEPAEEEDDPFKDIPKMDPEKYEPEVIEMFDSLLGVVKKQHEELRGLKTQGDTQTKEYAQANQEAATRELTSWFDLKVKDLGKDFHKVLGEGKMDSLLKGGSQFTKREEIANRMAVSQAGHNVAGIPAPSRDDLFDEATRSVLREEYQQIREKKLIIDLKKQGTQHIQRVGNRGNKQSQDPQEETAAMLDRKFGLK